MCWFDERGISRLCAVSVGQGTVTWHQDDLAFMQRLTITADASGGRMISQGEMAKEGAAWTDDLSQTFYRGLSMSSTPVRHGRHAVRVRHDVLIKLAQEGNHDHGSTQANAVRELIE